MLGIATGARLTAKTLESDLDRIKSLDADAVRWYPVWSAVEQPLGAARDWTYPDRVVDACRARGLEIVLGISATRDGARNACDPALIAPRANYAAEMTQRYFSSGVVLGIEGPNEVMLGRHTAQPKYDPDPSPARYLPVQRAFFESIKAVEPTVLVGLCSIIGQADWLQGLYDLGAKPFFDFVPYHPYTRPLSPTEAIRSGHGGFPAMYDARAVMVASRDAHKQVWVTEFGTNTGGRGAVSEDVQAHDLTDAVKRFRKHAWAGPFFTFCGWDADNPTNDPGDWMGLLRTDRTEKLAATTFRGLAQLA